MVDAVRVKGGIDGGTGVRLIGQEVLVLIDGRNLFPLGLKGRDEGIADVCIEANEVGILLRIGDVR